MKKWIRFFVFWSNFPILFCLHIIMEIYCFIIIGIEWLYNKKDGYVNLKLIYETRPKIFNWKWGLKRNK